MKATRLENKVAKVDNSTAKLMSLDDEEVTAVTSVSRADFVLSERDVNLIQIVADEQGISYDAAVHAVLRDALDIYHWNYMRIGNRRAR